MGNHRRAAELPCMENPWKAHIMRLPRVFLEVIDLVGKYSDKLAEGEVLPAGKGTRPPGSAGLKQNHNELDIK